VISIKTKVNQQRKKDLFCSVSFSLQWSHGFSSLAKT